MGLSFCHIPTKHQLVDLFTKPLGKVKFLNLLSKMGIHNDRGISTIAQTRHI